MKKLMLIIVILVATFSCNKKLDVDPQNTLTPTQIQSEEDVLALLFGAYSTIQQANAFGEMYNTLTELMFSDNDLAWAGTFSDYDDIFNKNQIANNFTIYQVWANAYHTINISNTVLSKLDLVSEDNKAIVEGEAKFFRAIIYFQLVNMFAQPYSAGNTSSNPGVPLILQSVQGYEPQRDQLARASVEDVYTHVLADLNDAKDKLPEEPENFRASRYSALA